ncbi:hypothetical protein TSUD_294120 [Trifolium subterraneum]|uniref:Reverse transcriptase zinc-binding domain-containing protein n=1 Tax=Trifolium subterraneum TaxID=3900 RepID=A0A2Z6M3I1_TRISU|nr:hypothetical protein TSUD_294120 [Trifolium subterraneum]
MEMEAPYRRRRGLEECCCSQIWGWSGGKSGNWLSQVVKRRMGGGSTISFWKDIWVGDQTLQHRFPRLYGISMQQNNSVREVGNWVEGGWRWELLWRRNFFAWEEELVRELEDVIRHMATTEEEDRWVWIPNEADGFSVKSLYVFLEGMFLPTNHLCDFERFTFKKIWKTPVPSKVCALAWQVCLDRIPTKENLVSRKIMRREDALCPTCGETIETVRHLFLHCRFASAVWYRVNRWLGTMVVIPHDIIMSHGLLVGCGGNKKVRKGYSIVWLAFVWVIWRFRNDRVFNNINGEVEDAMDSIQRLSWQWYLLKTAKGSSLLYEWVWNPGDCMLR